MTGTNRSNIDLEQLITQLAGQKTSLRIEGLNNIHPIYEALIALMKKNLQDRDLYERFVKDENSLREVLVTEAILDRLDSPKKTALITLFKSGASLKEIVDRAAIDIAENKRTKDGKVLQSAQNYSYGDAYFMSALKYISPSSVYLDSSEIPKIQEESKQIRKKRKTRLIAVGLASLGILLGGYVSGRYNASKPYSEPKTTSSEKIPNSFH